MADKKSDASELASALREVITATRPVEKKTPFNRTVNTPWMPKDGSKKLKLRKRIFQHGTPVEDDILSNQEIEALNQLKPGTYCDGFVRVIRRKDRGLDIDYPIKTPSQKLRLVNQYGIRNLTELIIRCVEESKRPKPADGFDDNDD